MRPPSLGAGGMSVSVLMVLCTAGLLATAASATQPASQVLRASCDRYTDGTQKSLCLDMLAKLQQSLPAHGAGTARLHARTASVQYRGEEHPQQQEPWYSHGPEDDTPYYILEGPPAEYEPSGGREQPPVREGPPPPYRYGQDPSAPSEPLIPTISTTFSISVTPKNTSATGRLTQDDFDDWSVRIRRSAELNGESGDEANRLSVTQSFECAGPVTFDVVGTVVNPTSLIAQCNMVPLLGRVDVGAKFDWQQAQQPRSWITVPNPTEVDYAAFVPGPNFFYQAAVSSIQSPVAFSGSIVDLMMDVLLGQPADYAFAASANSFVDLSRVPGAGKELPENATAPSRCDKLTAPAHKLLCQQQESKLKTPLQQWSSASPPSAPPLKAPSGGQVPIRQQIMAAAGAAGAGKAQQERYGDGYYHSTAPILLVPGSSSYLNIDLTAAGDVANATGHLNTRDFNQTDILLVRSAILTDRQQFITDNALSVDQFFKCAPPVELYFSGPVNQPNTIHVGCRMEALLSMINVGPKFPWSEAGSKRNEIVVEQPQWARYILRPADNSGRVLSFDGMVTDIESQVPFAGSIAELMTDALFGKPPAFDFEADVAALYL